MSSVATKDLSAPSAAKYRRVNPSAFPTLEYLRVASTAQENSSAAKGDFVVLFSRHGLDHLTQQIMLTLVSAEEEDCSLPEVKLVSGAWRDAVDGLVLRADVGKIAFVRRVKEVIRSALGKLAASTLLLLTELGLSYYNNHPYSYDLENLIAILGEFNWDEALRWKQRILRSQPEPSDAHTRALRAMLVYRLFWAPFGQCLVTV